MGGKLFDVQPISAAIAPYVQQAIIDELHSVYPDLECLTIGSVGKKKDEDFNSDIDRAIKCDTIDHLEQIVNTVFDYTESAVKESLYIVSIKYPYSVGHQLYFVQCDFMLMHDKDYTAFRYYCPNYRNNESKYRVGAKIMFANMILNHVTGIRKDIADKQYIVKADFTPIGLYRYIIDKENNRYREEFITTDVNKICAMCFADADPKHFDSVESLWDAIHSPIFADPNEVKTLERNWFINCWRKGWTSIVPEDFKIQYWTNDQIWGFINQQKIINNVNRIFAKNKEI